MNEPEYSSLQSRLATEAQRIGAPGLEVKLASVPTLASLESRRRKRRVAGRFAVASLFSAGVVATVLLHLRWQPDDRASETGRSDSKSKVVESSGGDLSTEMEITLAPSARARLESLVDLGAVPVVVVRPDEAGRNVLIPGVYVPATTRRLDSGDLSPVQRRAIRNVMGSEAEMRPDAI